MWERLCATTTSGAAEPVEIQGDAHWYELTCVPIPEEGFANVYGTDVTALRALRRFPLQSPWPQRSSGNWSKRAGHGHGW